MQLGRPCHFELQGNYTENYLAIPTAETSV